MNGDDGDQDDEQTSKPPTEGFREMEEITPIDDGAFRPGEGIDGDAGAEDDAQKSQFRDPFPDASETEQTEPNASDANDG